MTTLIGTRLPATLLLGGTVLLLNFTLGTWLGVLQARHRGTGLDRWLTRLSLAGYAMPSFWLALILVSVASLDWQLLPAAQMRDPLIPPDAPGLTRALDVARHRILPALTLAIVSIAGTMRYQRTAMLQALRQDYVRAARARGLSERRVVWGHAWRNALFPMLTLFGLWLPILVTGSVFVDLHQQGPTLAPGRERHRLGRLRVLGGVVEQVVEGAPQKRRVCVQLGEARAQGHLRGAAGMVGSEALGGPRDQLGPRDRLAPQRHLRPGPPLGQVEPGSGEDVLHQAFHLGEVLGDLSQEAAGSLQVPLGGEVQRHPDAGERRAQLVRDVGEQLLLLPEQPLQPLRHLVEGPAQLAHLVGAVHMGPVIKIGTNTPLARVNGDIDINAGTILEGEETIQQVGEKIFYETLDVVSGRKTPEAEASGYHHEFKVWEALWPTL